MDLGGAIDLFQVHHPAGCGGLERGVQMQVPAPRTAGKCATYSYTR